MKSTFAPPNLSAAAVLTSLLAPVALFAQEHGAHGGEHHGPSLLIYWLNFSIYVAFVYFVARKPVTKFWTDRRAAIAAAVDESAAASKSADLRLAEAESRKAALGRELQSIEAAILKDGEREASAVVAAAEEKAKRIVESAADTIEIERHAARLSMRNEVAAEVLRRAEELLRRGHTADSDRALREQGLSGIGALLH